MSCLWHLRPRLWYPDAGRRQTIMAAVRKRSAGQAARKMDPERMEKTLPELTAGLLLQRMPLRKRRMPGQPRKRKKQRPQRSVGPELRLLPPAARTRKPERRTLKLMPKKRTPKLMPKRRPPRPPQEAGPALQRMPLRQKRALRQPKRRPPRLPQGAGPALRLLPPAARTRKPKPKAPSPKRRGEEALMRKADPETLKKTNMPASAISPAPRWAFLSNTIRQIQRKTRRPAPVKW